MSLLNKASLIQIPSGYKDGTLYSAKPTNGDGDFTFSRGSNLAATRVNSDGLIEKGRENMLLQSNQFDTTWTLQNLTVTSGQSGYDGSNDAWKLTPSIDDTYHRLINTVTGASNSVVTLSVYAKADGYNFIRVSENAATGDYATFNLSTGIVENNTSLDAKIEDIGNGWYRCSSTIIPAATHRFDMYVMETATVQQPWDGDGTSGIIIQDAQFELGLVATDYIETGASTAQAGILEDMPRLDYSGGASCPSLLLEPSRTQLLTQSEYFDTTPYSKVNATVTTNDITSPEGVLNATKLISTSGASRVETFPTLSDNTNYTASIFAKRGDVDYIMVNFREKSGNQHQTFFDLANGTKGTTNGSPISSSIKAVGDYYRVTLTINSSSGGSTPRLQYLIANTDNNVVTSSGEYIYVYGAMLEAGSITSYIPTYGASVTRSHDVCKITGADATDIINQPAMTLFVEAQLDDNGATTILSILRDLTGGLYNDFIALTYINSLKVNFEVRENASPQATIQSGVLSEGVHKIAAVLTSTSMKLFIDGSLENSATITAIPDDLDEIYLAGYPDTTARFGTKKQFLFFPTALSDDECEQLTTL